MSSVLGEGPTSAKLCILTDFPRVSAAAQGVPLFGWERQLVEQALLSAGITPSECRWESCLDFRPYDGNPYSLLNLEELKGKFLGRFNSLTKGSILTLGELPLNFLTGKFSIDKWHLSPLSFGKSKVMPSFHPERIGKQYHLQVYLKMACQKLANPAEYWPSCEKNFLLNPNFEETILTLKMLSYEPLLSVDIETGRGMINTVGFAWSSDDAIAINVLPDRLGNDKHFLLWEHINALLRSDQKKIFQNFLYEQMYFSRYGIKINNVHWDTMWAQKFLWPELKAGLDEVGRIYTREPYWKDDGKSWNNIRDWQRHYHYNMLDTTGTFAGYLGQEEDMRRRGIHSLFTGYLMRLTGPISEMCGNGLPVSAGRLETLRNGVDKRVCELTSEIQGVTGEHKFNPNSNLQIKKYYLAKGYKLPKKRDSKGTWKDSTDEKSLKKLQVQHPEDTSLELFLQYGKNQKALSSYLTFTYDEDGMMRYMLNGCATETGRMAGYTDPWDQGVNPQTIPGGNKGINIKRVFECPEGRTFVAIDLRQAESRFVAYDSCDPNLIEMLENPKKDIHRYVAAEIFQKPEDEITKQERQLGKKSSHGANYNMGINTFVDQCLGDGITISQKEARNVLESYHRLFPGIRRWHKSIREEVARTRRLSNPLGRERYFYGRLDDNLFREAYAYKPQSTIPDITNFLMLHLTDQRGRGRLNFRLHLQCHDSLLLSVRDNADDLRRVQDIASAGSEWHPEVILPAGRLVIPVSIEVGRNWGHMKEITT